MYVYHTYLVERHHVEFMRRGSYQTNLDLLREFFPNRDIYLAPRMTYAEDRRVILDAVAGCLTELGKMSDAFSFYLRALDASPAIDLITGQLPVSISEAARQMTVILIHQGNLGGAMLMAAEAISSTRRARGLSRRQVLLLPLRLPGLLLSLFDKYEVSENLALQAWIDHLTGNLPQATMHFQQSAQIEGRLHPRSLPSIYHAEHLCRIGSIDDARQLMEAKLAWYECHEITSELSACHRVLGDLATSARQHEIAQQHYHQSLLLARDMTRRHILIEALLAQGRWAARYEAQAGRGEPSEVAFNDLDEALTYALDGGLSNL